MNNVANHLPDRVVILQGRSTDKSLQAMRKMEQSLINQHFGFNLQITHLPNGAPILNGLIYDPHLISISHSHGELRILLAPLEKGYAPGIDIEKISQRVAKVRHKFLQEEEISFAEQAKDRDLIYTTLWTIKEAAYKSFQAPSADLKNSFKIITMAGKSINNISPKEIDTLAMEFELIYTPTKDKSKKKFYAKVENEFITTWCL